MQFLPVYYPTDEEMNDTKLYARNVQVLMARYIAIHLVTIYHSL